MIRTVEAVDRGPDLVSDAVDGAGSVDCRCHISVFHLQHFTADCGLKKLTSILKVGIGMTKAIVIAVVMLKSDFATLKQVQEVVASKLVVDLADLDAVAVYICEYECNDRKCKSL